MGREVAGARGCRLLAAAGVALLSGTVSAQSAVLGRLDQDGQGRRMSALLTADLPDRPVLFYKNSRFRKRLLRHGDVPRRLERARDRQRAVSA